MSVIYSVVDGVEALDVDNPREAKSTNRRDHMSQGVDFPDRANEQWIYPEGLTPKHVANSVLYIANELHAVAKDVRLTELDVQCFVDDITEVMEGSGISGFVDSTKAREFMKSRIGSRQSSVTDDSPSVMERANDNMMRGSRLQQASLQAVKLLSLFNGMNGRVYRHQIVGVVEGFTDIIANYIDHDYDGDPKTVVDDLLQTYWLERLPYHENEEASSPVIGVASPQFLGKISLGGQVRPQQYM